jgi:hypothetical protein
MGGIVSDQLGVIDGVNSEITTGSIAALKASNSCVRFKQTKAAKTSIECKAAPTSNQVSSSSVVLMMLKQPTFLLILRVSGTAENESRYLLGHLVP